MVSCKKEEPFNPCKDVSCPANQHCLNGSCVCDNGFIGEDCLTVLIVPVKIKINQVSVTRFPATKENSNSWDVIGVNGTPDIYVSMGRGANDTVFRTEVKWDEMNTQVHTWDLTSSNIYVSDPLSKFTIELYDRDIFNATDDLMGSINFNLYARNNEFPAEVVVDNGGGVAFVLYVEYVW